MALQLILHRHTHTQSSSLWGPCLCILPKEKQEKPRKSTIPCLSGCHLPSPIHGFAYSSPAWEALSSGLKQLQPGCPARTSASPRYPPYSSPSTDRFQGGQSPGTHLGCFLFLNALVGGSFLRLRESGGFALSNQPHSLHLERPGKIGVPSIRTFPLHPSPGFTESGPCPMLFIHAWHTTTT